ncbi:hypothetical protein V6Z11_D11G086900 [Gossypium hirsutum]
MRRRRKKTMEDFPNKTSVVSKVIWILPMPTSTTRVLVMDNFSFLKFYFINKMLRMKEGDIIESKIFLFRQLAIPNTSPHRLQNRIFTGRYRHTHYSILEPANCR